MVVHIYAALLSSCPARLRRRCRSWTCDGDAAAADARRDVASLSGLAGTFAYLIPTSDRPFVSAVKVEVHSSNSSSGAGSDENLSSSSSDRGSDPGTVVGENDYEDIYEVRHRAGGGGGGGGGGEAVVNVVGNHHEHGRGKESKSPSRDSGSHSRSGSMSSTGSGGTGGVVGSGSSVVVLHCTASGNVSSSPPSVNPPATVTNVTVDGSTNTTTAVADSSDSIECYEPVGAMTPGTCRILANKGRENRQGGQGERV